MFKNNFNLQTVSVFLFILILSKPISSQVPSPPIPIELMAGNQDLYFQMVVKKSFKPQSAFQFFGLSTYTSAIKDLQSTDLISIGQLSYTFSKGFGVFVGADVNSFSGLSIIAGPQHNFASAKWLAITTTSFFLNDDADLKVFGLYEFKPNITEQIGLYTRLQSIYNFSLENNGHNVSYIYLRAGIKVKSMIFGGAANLNWSGPNKLYQENYGLFVRYELK